MINRSMNQNTRVLVCWGIPAVWFGFTGGSSEKLKKLFFLYFAPKFSRVDIHGPATSANVG